MTQFKVPASKPIHLLDLENLGGCDEYSQVPLATRSPDMKNLIKRFGVHGVRENIEQTYIVDQVNYNPDIEDDKHCKIKWVGKIEEYDDLGNPIPYYIKISEYLGIKNKENDSYIYISVWPTPEVKNIKYPMSTFQGYEKYKITYKRFNFTNYGKTGNNRNLYENIKFDNKTYVFTPIGILSFDCSTDEPDAHGNIQLNFTVHNVLDDPYVPTIQISKRPNVAGINYEAVNLLTNKRKVKFLGTESDTNYYLPEKSIVGVNNVQVLQNNGQFKQVTNYTVDTVTGKITFSSAPGVSPVPGKDNIIVEYSKTPGNDNETNEFTFQSTSTYFMTTTKITKGTYQGDTSKIQVSITVNIVKTSNYTDNKNLESANYILNANGKLVLNKTLSSSEIASIKGSGLTFTSTAIINNDGSTSRNWTSLLKSTIKTTTTTTTTTGVPGSKGNNTSGHAEKGFYGNTWKMVGDFSIEAHVGSKADGSDSYWTVYGTPYIYVGPYGSGVIPSRAMGMTVDGTGVGTVYSGAINKGSGYESVYGGDSLSRRINYSSSKKTCIVKTWAEFQASIGDTYIGDVNSGEITINLPSLQPPTLKTVTNTTVSSAVDNNSCSYTESFTKSDTSDLDYSNDAEKSARLACYYSVKAATVYGYENDRRVFVTNGTNTDTFSGRSVDPNYSSISYFPDVNYSVLGEDSNILGYAQKAGYLITIKEGADSLFVRKGAQIGNELQFPSVFVRRNVQVLCRPIEIDGNVYILTRNGLEEISFVYTQSYTYDLITYLRSYYITNYFQLGSDYKYKQMEWFNENGLLHIFLDNYEFVFDLDSKSYPREVSSSLGTQQKTGLPYQFEAYVCTVPDLNSNLYAPCTTVYLPKDFERAISTVVYEDIIPIGYNETGVYKFRYNDFKVDKLLTLEESYNIFNKYDVRLLDKCTISYYGNSIILFSSESSIGKQRAFAEFKLPLSIRNKKVTLSCDNYEILSGDNTEFSMSIAEIDKDGYWLTELPVEQDPEDNKIKVYTVPGSFIHAKAVGYVVALNVVKAKNIQGDESIRFDNVQVSFSDHKLPYETYGLKEVVNYYPIKAHYYSTFMDFDTTMQLKTIRQLTINTPGKNGDEYYVGYVVPDGTQLLIDKVVNTAQDTTTKLRNEMVAFPKIISVKNKIRKFSNFKLFIKNKADYENISKLDNAADINTFNDMAFNRITMKYVDAGKYKGD